MILSSDQAKACRRIGETEWTVFDEDNYIDTNAAYTIRRANGQIAVFFYNKSLSDAVSFEHLLRDADQLANRILTLNEPAEDTETAQNENEQAEAKPKPQCVKITDETLAAIVADGKVFGHHEPFADMCLSGLISKYGIDSDQIRFMNPAEYLSECPPEWEIMLHIGEDHLGSSWSCPHGVGRWYRECGCKFGQDSSQQWRTPFRDALNLIKNEADEIYVRYAGLLVDCPNEVRNDYIAFIDSGYDMGQLGWLTAHALHTLTEDETANLLQLLEAQRCAVMSFCSDAWCSDDIYSEAALKSLRLAHRAVNILECYGSKIRSTVEDKLNEAKSNYPGKDSGRAILDYYIYGSTIGYEQIINNMLSVYRIQKNLDMSRFALFGMYHFSDLTVEAAAGHNDLYIGEVTVTDRRVAVKRKFSYIYQIVSDKSYRLFVANEDKAGLLMAQADYIAKGGNASFDGCIMMTENDLDSRIKTFILEHRYQSYTHALLNQNIAGYGDVRQQAASYMSAGIGLPIVLSSQLLSCADSIIEDIASKLVTFPTADEYKLLHEVFVLTGHFGLHPHSQHLSQRLITILTEQLDRMNDILGSVCSDAVILMQFCNKMGLNDVRVASENVIFAVFRQWTARILETLPTVNDEQRRNEYLLRYKQLIIMADLCNISASSARKSMMNYLTNSETDNPHRF